MSEQGAVPELAFANAAEEAVLPVDGEPVAIELFDAHESFRKFMKKAIGSFAVDALEVGGTVVHLGAFRV